MDAPYDFVTFPEIAPPPLRGTVWVLGQKYTLPEDKALMTDDVRSRLWCTYRKNFRPISGTNYTSDHGWGCTLRCGQMLLAQALICQHLGREWRWKAREDNAVYMKILSKFLDTRDSDYSIQMIASQGADFGRQVGQWFGPNNAAQAIKKLSAHDKWSQLAVHVALDMVVVIEDIKSLCREPHIVPRPVKISTQLSVHHTSEPTDSRHHSRGFTFNKTKPTGAFKTGIRIQIESTPKNFGIGAESGSPSSSQLTESVEYMKLSMADFANEKGSDGVQEKEEEKLATGTSCFRSLLLFIPLRLGQERFNPEYAEALKACLTLPQSVGVIGGRPRHALYLIGYHGDYVMYLDPHTTQPTVHSPDPNHIPDSTYHCSQPERMLIEELDPSLAIGFFCKDENDIDDLCRRLRKDVLCKMRHMFDLTEKRPAYWGPMETSSLRSVAEPFFLMNPEEGDSDSDGFEVIEWPPYQ